MAPKRKVGRPKKVHKEINTVRQVGRWTDDDWATIQAAAVVTDGGNVSAFAKRVLMRAARRVLNG